MGVAPQHDDIGRNLIRTLRCDRDLAEIAASLSEAALDDFLDEGLAKELPLVKSIRAAFKAFGSYRNYLITKKLICFFENLESVPQDQREAQIAMLASDAPGRQRLGDNLMLLLDRLDDLSKPEMLANAWSAYLKKQISREQLLDLHTAIDRVRIHDLPVLIDVYLGQISEAGLPFFPPWRDGMKQLITPPYGGGSDENRMNHVIWSRLSQLAWCGLFDSFHGRGGAIGGHAGGLRPNDLGSLFVAHVLRRS